MFSIEMQVRDHECDLQGVVNNAVYMNYLEHARHQYLHSLGINFADYTAQQIHLMLVRAELDFKASLKPNDVFKVTVKMERESRIKYAFIQEVIRLADDKVMLKAKNIGVALNPNGKPTTFKPFDDAIQD
ncbi:acyl-CoA thioesterase [Thiomicrorhabdus xiamenensis]|uniref:Acyl-CoA thioesterase n=1 Tax=Thiomicrorhabdus xiamenensis TaxID=2739063 RepID=A0A7D4NKG0_9GAMM|nr:acyl-CoA thioesterase [Thiomicrorhabdus xiamenensis]QKI88374.1 acyl-CoA thioesterase [Thiomicrorhabdus xiamenensis]